MCMRGTLILLFGGLALSCAPSEQEIRTEFEEFLSEHQACSEDSDCTLIYPGCPLGCSTPITADAADKGIRLAEELIHDYESGGVSCQYQCAAVCGASCKSARCVAAAETSDGCP